MFDALYNANDEAIAREEAKLKSRRERDEERRARFLDARKRTTGIDVAALDAQVEEALRKRQISKEESLSDRQRILEIQRVLEAAVEDERHANFLHAQEIKATWENQRSEVTSRREQQLNERRAPMAHIKFSGEDTGREARLKEQKSQVRQWVQEQMSAKSQRQIDEKNTELDYAEMVKTLDSVRESNHLAEMDLRRSVAKEVMQENNKLATMRRQLEEEELIKQKKAQSRPFEFFDPSTKRVMMADGRVRRDMFAGFTSAQRKKILQENEIVIQQKRELAEAERQYEEDWVLQQAIVARAVEQAHHETNTFREEENQRLMLELSQQQEIQRAKKIQSKQQRFGAVEPGFFNKFGTSAR